MMNEQKLEEALLWDFSIVCDYICVRTGIAREVVEQVIKAEEQYLEEHGFYMEDIDEA